LDNQIEHIALDAIKIDSLAFRVLCVDSQDQKNNVLVFPGDTTKKRVEEIYFFDP